MTRATPRKTPRRRYTGLIWLTGITALASVGAQLGALHWLGDWPALVIDYLFGLCGLLFIALVLVRRWRWALVIALAALLNGTQLVAFTPAQATAPSNGASLRLMVYNIYHLNPNLDQVVAEVRKHNPDLLFLMEYSDAIQAQIEDQFADYPYRLIRPSRFTMGVALFSRIPFDEATIHRFEATRIPIVEAELTLDGQRVGFVGGHPWPPRPQWGQLHRDQMAAITAIAAQARQPLIIAGDFNATAWSYTFQHLASTANVRDLRPPASGGKTWQPIPVPFFGFDLDHVLASEAWHLVTYQQGAAGGSDHRPIVVDLRLAPTTP